MQHKIFCVREFIKTESATAVQRAFRLRFDIQPPTRKSICRRNHQFEQIGCLCKGISSGRRRVSEESIFLNHAVFWDPTPQGLVNIRVVTNVPGGLFLS